MTDIIDNEDERFYKEIFIGGEYEFGIPNKKDMIVVDIGAHSGIFSEYVYTRSKVIYAIEADLDNFERLKNRIIEKGLKKIKPFNYGVGNSTEERNVYVHAGQGGYSITNVNDKIKSKVKGITLRKFIEDNSIQHIDLLKIDCEGAEHEILNDELGETISIVSSIVGELHSESEDIIFYLEKSGFIVSRVVNSFSAQR
ncbi:MAG: FkbM family methyltransferase [Patescibacteria group bacterium]